ncbi:TonB-dependent receptor, partial [bacterium]|nr:TonB-dependent receptor [bacterium]
PELGRGTSSDSGGEFYLNGIPDGVYRIEVRHVSYNGRTIQQLPISSYQNPYLVLEMVVRVWQSDSIMVTAIGSQLQLQSGHPVFRQQLPPVTDINTICRVLQEIPGVQLRRTGGEGAVISLDGCPPEQVMICIDGVPLNPGGSDVVDLSTVSLTDATAVEVVRGAGQTVFGSSGGGVVNFITASRPDNNGNHLSLTSIPAVNVGMIRSWSGLAVSGEGRYSSGNYPFHDPARDDRLFRQVNSAHHSLKGAVTWSRQLLELRTTAVVARHELPPLLDERGSSNLQRFSRQLSFAGSMTGGAQNGQMYCNAQAVDYDADAGSASPITIASSYRYLDAGVSWELKRKHGRGYVAAVANQYAFNDRTEAAPSSRGNRRLLRGGGVVILPAYRNFPALEIEAGGAAVLAPQYRLDPFIGLRTNSQYGSGQLHLSVEQGLHYPAFLTQFPLEAFQVQGNPDLLPERFVDLRVGWLQSGEHLLWQLEYSRKLARDLIRWQRGNGNIYRPVNLECARIQAMTLFGRYRLPTAGWTITGSLQLLDPRNTTPDDINEGMILPLRQLIAGYLRLSGSLGKHFGDITMQFGSRQYTLEANTSHLSLGYRDLHPYSLTSITIGRRMHNSEVVFRIDNLFNQDVQRLERRMEPLCTFNLQLRWQH